MGIFCGFVHRKPCSLVFFDVAEPLIANSTIRKKINL
jgi:hypothetical protein